MENILRVLKVVKRVKTNDGVSPMTYAKLKELGYESEDWENWSDEEKVKRSQEQKQQGKEENSSSGKKDDTIQYRTPEDMVEGELKKLGKTDEDIKKLTRADYDYYAQVFSKALGINFKNTEGFHNTRYLNKHEYDSINDALTDEEIDQLIKEEEDAIASYEAALKVAVSPVAKDRLQHILEEEQEHVQELRNLKAQPTHDSEKDVYEIKNEAGHYVVYKNNIRFASCDSFSEAVKEIKDDGGNA